MPYVFINDQRVNIRDDKVEDFAKIVSDPRFSDIKVVPAQELVTTEGETFAVPTTGETRTRFLNLMEIRGYKRKPFTYEEGLGFKIGKDEYETDITRLKGFVTPEDYNRYMTSERQKLEAERVESLAEVERAKQKLERIEKSPYRTAVDFYARKLSEVMSPKATTIPTQKKRQVVPESVTPEEAGFVTEPLEQIELTEEQAAELFPAPSGISPTKVISFEQRVKDFIQLPAAKELKSSAISSLANADVAMQLASGDPDEDAIVKGIKRINENPPSQDLVDFVESKTTEEALKKLAKKPFKLIPELIAASLPAMVSVGIRQVPGRAAAGTIAGGAAGLLAPALAPVTIPAGLTLGFGLGMGETSQILKSGELLLEAMQQIGVDPSDPEQLKNLFENPQKFGQLKQAAETLAIPVAALDMLSAVVAGRLFAQPATSFGGKMAQFSVEMGNQMALGAGGEALSQVAQATGVRPGEVVAEAAGELGGGLGEITVGRLTQALQRQVQAEQEVQRARPEVEVEAAGEVSIVEGQPTVTEPTVEVEERTPLREREGVEEPGEAEQTVATEEAAPSEVAEERGVPPVELPPPVEVPAPVVPEQELELPSVPAPPRNEQKTTAEEQVRTPEDQVSLVNAAVEQAREDFGLDQLPPSETVKWSEHFEQAKESGMDQRALDIAADLDRNPRQGTAEEYAAMSLKYTDLFNEREQTINDINDAIENGQTELASSLNQKLNRIMDDIDLLHRASKKAKSNVARALNFSKVAIDRKTYDIGTTIQRARAAKQADLTSKEQQELTALTKQLEQTEQRLAELEKKNEALEEQIKRKDAESFVEGFKKRSARRVPATLAEQEADILRQLRGKGVRMLSGIDPEVAVLLIKLAKIKIQQGATNLTQVSNAIREDIDVSNLDIIEALSTKTGKAVEQAKKEAQQTLRDIRSEANDATKIIELLRGTSRKKVERGPIRRKQLRRLMNRITLALRRTETNPALRADIQNRLETAQDLLEEAFGDSQTLPREDNLQVAEALGIMEDVNRQLNLQDKIADLQKQIETGDFKVPVKRKKTIVSEQVKRAEAQRDLLKRKIDQEIAKKEPITFKKIVRSAGRFTMAMRLGWEFSALLNQGGPLAWANPRRLAQSIDIALRSFRSAEDAQIIYMSLVNSRVGKLAQEVDLFLSEVGGPMNQTEEIYRDNLITRIPGVGRLFDALQRANVNGLDFIRLDAFKKFLQANPDATMDEMRATARMINYLTGRGDLGSVSGAADTLSNVIISPRFFASRFQTFPQAIRMLKSKSTRKFLAQNMGAWIGLNLALITMAKMAGFESPDDPEDPDWGKIVMGPLRLDLWSGFRPFVRTAVLLARSGMRRAGIESAKEYKRIDPVEEMFRLIEYRASPITAGTRATFTGKDAVGKEVSAVEASAKQLIPLFVEDVTEAIRNQEGYITGITTAAGLTGVRANIYENAMARSEIKPVLRHADIKKAPTLSRDAPGKPRSEVLPAWTEGEPKFSRNMKLAFGSALAAYIAENKSSLMKLSPKAAKLRIQLEASRIRRIMKLKIPDEKPEGFDVLQEKIQKQLPEFEPGSIRREPRTFQEALPFTSRTARGRLAQLQA